MVNFPTSLDDDSTIPAVNDNITEIGDEAINALRDAVFALETEVGIGASGTAGSIASRLGVSLEANGSIKSSALTSLGLVTLPISDSQISASAQIKESKLELDYSTTDLYNLISNQGSSLNTALTFIQGTGAKIEPHLIGSVYRHVLNHIDVSTVGTEFFRNSSGVLRDNTDLYTLLSDINDDLVSHEKANNTDTGEAPPENYGHLAAGIFINTSNFSFIPQTATDLQQFAQFIDNSNIFILGTRIQSLYNNGIARTARSGSLINNTNGQSIIPSTTVITYFLNSGATAPVDDIDTGDDIIEFMPSSASIANSSFDAKFSAIKIGDVITVNYGSFSVPNIIIEKKIIVSGSDKRYVVRIDRLNIMAGTAFTATVDKPLFNNNKYGVLALAQANTFTNDLPSLILGNPRGAQVLGINFNADQLDKSHYNLYLTIYPDGDPTSGFTNLAAIDVTGNKGITPGKYTLRSIVEATNNSFRKAGFNYRFIAFSYNGEFGIMLADPYGNASFSIIDGALDITGAFDNGLSRAMSPNNVIGVPGFDNNDALGFGPGKGNVASPPYATGYSSSDVAQNPAKIFVPLTRNNYYVNGVERERFNIEPGQVLDTYGDGYWVATITNKTTVPGTRVEITYRIEDDLSDVKWKPGQTLVAQSIDDVSTIFDAGRYFIKNIQYNGCPGPTAFTNITVYDAIHAIGSSPYPSAAIGTKVGLYFNGDSVGFSEENASDYTASSSIFKRFFEIFVNQDGYTFSHERARLDISGSNTVVNDITIYNDLNLTEFNLYKVSPKLRGYAFSSVNKINLRISSFDQATGIFSGYLCKYDGSTVSNSGPITTGKKGNVVRFYDETNIDYIDIFIELTASVPQINSTKHIDIQLFPTLSLDDEVMMLGTCQVNNSSNKVQYLIDERQFGNVSEKQLSTSALDFISTPTQLLHENGIIQGFDLGGLDGDGYNVLHINGGIAVVNGRILDVNDQYITIPVLQETLYPLFDTEITTIKWFVCLNDNGKYELVASTDFDINGSFAASYNLLVLDHTRLFYVQNPNDIGGAEYPIIGTYFSDLILNYRNLTPIAIITAPIVLSGADYIIDTSVVIEDARRFIANGYGGMNTPFTFGTQASFRTFEALNAWLTNLNKYKSFAVNLVNKIGDIVLVKDDMDISGKNLSFGNKVRFVGDGGKFTVTSSATLTDISLSNLRVDISSNTGLSYLGTKNTISDGYINYIGGSGGAVYPITVNSSSSLIATGTLFKRNAITIGAYIKNNSSLSVVATGNRHESSTLVSGTTSTTNASDA